MFSSLRPARRVLGASLLALAAAGCQSESVSGPEAGTDYYPLALGDYRIYAVTDSTWENFTRQPVSRYQFRERLAERITDASGQPAYRVIRSKRVLATDPWRDDSVLVVSGSEKTLLLTRNNRRTVELVFPVRADRAWNKNAYNSLTDSVQGTENRRYLGVGEPFTASANGQSFHYEHTVTTEDIDDISVDDGLYEKSKYRQVYAQGSGPVYRVRRRLGYCSGPGCSPEPGKIFKGRVRTEVLVEKGNTP
ncbi:hypothetical protein [Hymenobacter persicinus]|uniref:Lipoprotein n=1 Tax=Hymenobacter persicinus TaxID=2025506 RepID=A0A4Q5LHC1_9BACT|nr:hypothetical protein [Hymenobacter persicinus]RYU83353.1 hypothetical protein EWM57_03445 [Hymenobacter persicinus]